MDFDHLNGKSDEEQLLAPFQLARSLMNIIKEIQAFKYN